MDFTGKIALVTGASKGIGRAVAIRLANGGADLVLVDINYAGLEAVKAELAPLGRKIYIYECDVANEERVNEVCADALKQLGRVDILINNAGIYNTHIPFLQTNSKIWKQKIDINIYGTMYFTYAILPSMLEHKYGRIVNLASVAGVYGLADMTDYSMTKGAIIGFTKGLAKEVSAQGVTVNAISPGSISDNPAAMPDFNFVGYSGSPDQCAAVICFLATKEAEYVSGQNYLVDGCRKKM